jgi:NTP pyrophosphatase (non-canonical NTP hydrolase)
MDNPALESGLAKQRDLEAALETLRYAARGVSERTEIPSKQAAALLAELARNEEYGMPSGNGLTPQQAELLAVLAEECGEVVQAVGKILRHGITDRNPSTGVSNDDALAREIGDVRAIVILLQEHGGLWLNNALRDERLRSLAADKIGRIGKYLHHTPMATAESMKS